MTISSIDHPIELLIEQRNTGKGKPNAILQYDVSLNNNQNKLLNKLNGFDSQCIVSKKSVSMTDLSALTAKQVTNLLCLQKETKD